MSRALRALTAEPWAIQPHYLHFMAELATLGRDGRAHRRDGEARDWSQMDVEALATPSAGPAAKRMDGARYSVLTADGVAILPVFGPIFPRANIMTEMSGATSATMLQADLRVLLDAADVHAIMLLMDTPGGAVSGINAFADQVFAARGAKPILAHVSGTAASAGYWIASAAPEIVVEKTSIAGSIGVVAGIPKQMEPDGDGAMTIEIVSTNAPNKRPDPSTEEGAAEIRSMLDAIETQFIADVARGRNVGVATVRSEFGKGGVKVGKDIVAAGMADRVQSYEQSYAQLAKAASNRRRVKALKI